MTARGRQYYDPEIQAARKVPGEQNLNRIEVYPVGPESTARLPQEVGKWASRLVDSEGHVIEQGASDFQQEAAIALAQTRWPGLEVYALGAEIEDSTWEGVGPSPRLWRNAEGVAVSSYITDEPVTIPLTDPTPAVDLPDFAMASDPEACAITAIVASKPGAYIHIEDVILLLEDYAQQYDDQGNPSGALALREAASALKEPF